MVAHSTVNRVVRGSSPLTGAIYRKADLRSRVGFFTFHKMCWCPTKESRLSREKRLSFSSIYFYLERAPGLLAGNVIGGRDEFEHIGEPPGLGDFLFAFLLNF